MAVQTKPTLDTDTPLTKLMMLSGNRLLKLLGMTATQAEQYRFRATVLEPIQRDIGAMQNNLTNLTFF